MVAEPEREACALPLLDERERQRLIMECHDTAQPVSPTGLIERHEAQVRLEPDRLAVVGSTDRLDHASLDLRSGRLGRARS